jgi:hypothetical protein
MAKLRRATVYFNPRVYRALKIRAATADRAISEYVNTAVREALLEDARDLEVIKKRGKQPVRPLSEIVRELKREGLL